MKSSSLFAQILEENLLISILPQLQIENLLFILLVLAVILLLVQRRMICQKHQAALDAMRTRISSDLHDDVGTLLSGLAMQAELLELNPHEIDAAKLSRMAEMSRTAMSRMRDLVWTIDNRKSQWKHLIDRLYEHADDVLGPLGIDFELQLQGIDQNRSLPPVLRRNLYCIGKEAITNVAKHSDAGHVKIMIQQKNGNYDMHIQDNGQCATQKHKRPAGLGLSNIRWRAKQLGASLSFQNGQGFGILLQRIQMYS
ncbi:MAG: hypothetical protein KTR30_11420 [Saprospiraceae bacterium]|nr:hypothetical protein [Saprospiraceae bacterium]